MSSPDLRLWPIAIIQDRYSGFYSGGSWLAVARADLKLEGRPRVTWAMQKGPGDGDVACATFWDHAPPWIAAGATPEDALSTLRNQPGADSDEWEPWMQEGV